MYPSGRHWPFLLEVNAVTYYADTLSDLVDVFVPGYVEMVHSLELGVLSAADKIHLSMRSRLLEMARERQVEIVKEAVESNGLDPSQLSGDLLVALRQDKEVPFVGLPDGDALSLHWDYALPLILIASDYSPFTDLAKPTGHNLIFVDATSERSFLDSASRLGLCKFLIRGKGTNEINPI